MHAAPAAGAALRRLHFVPAQRQDAHGVSPADLERLIKLNSEPAEAQEPADGAMARSGDRAAGRKPAQRRELFKSEDLSLQWREIRKAGSGLQNLGNTCFMNSVLQSLVHTAPLAELLLSQSAARLHNGAVNGFYPIQLARELVSRSLAHHSRGPHAPLAFAKSLRRISRSFRLGRQEDAHEFLIALLDAMHEASIAHMQPKPPPEVAHTSFIYRIFGGRMRSQVKCSECGYESNTYDPCIDLSLEITRAQTVKRALERFTAGEALDGANKYKCPKQQKAVRAVKRMTVDAAPNVLMIQLKRFEFSFSGHKISKKQPPAAVGKQQAAEAGAPQPVSGKAAKAAAAAAAAPAPTAAGGSKKPWRESEAAAAAAAPSSAEEEGPPSAKRHHPLQQNGRISKKSRLRAMRGMDEEAHAASPMRPLRQFGAILSPLVMLNRRGARLAEAVNISMNPLRRLSRRKAKAAAAAAAAAAAPGLAAAAGQEDSGGSSGAAGGSATTSVVSAPDWPPAAPSSSGRASGEADVRAFLRKSGGGAKLPLSPWEDADAAAKRQQAQLLRQDAPKRKRLDEYDLEYDKGRTKKVKSKRQSGGDGGGDGVQGADFDAAWQQKQHSGVKTELRGNRKRRSQDFKRQQQQQQGRRHSGGRGRPSFGGRGGRHGRGRR
ncbi:hypothetical protein COHA_007427 [Chlorella ohadii]|uniref:ubiquitinyl hydrolase 1 n=1 Tax=Chlorella ohadii TaxID=2649997 RepID=A0AAD5DJH9_9CHLO|nr:hypothetical protein COHA_007427 [Chlorella ohadii]